MRPGIWQIIACIVVFALLFGAKKIPDLARSLGKAKGEFKKGLKEGEVELKKGLAEAEAAEQPSDAKLEEKA